MKKKKIKVAKKKLNKCITKSRLFRKKIKDRYGKNQDCLEKIEKS